MTRKRKNDKSKPSKSALQSESSEATSTPQSTKLLFDEATERLNDPEYIKQKLDKEKLRIQNFENIYKNVDTTLYNKDYILFIELQQFADSIPVWRRIKVSGGIYLNDLRRILNAAVGWSGSHSFQFEIFLPGDDLPVTIHSDAGTLELLSNEKELSSHLHSQAVTLAMIAPRISGQHTTPKQLSEKEAQKLQQEDRKKTKPPAKKKTKNT